MEVLRLDLISKNSEIKKDDIGLEDEYKGNKQNIIKQMVHGNGNGNGTESVKRECMETYHGRDGSAAVPIMNGLKEDGDWKTEMEHDAEGLGLFAIRSRSHRYKYAVILESLEGEKHRVLEWDNTVTCYALSNMEYCSRVPMHRICTIKHHLSDTQWNAVVCSAK